MARGGTIVCGVVDADEGRDAAELACALGSRLDLRVVLVSVVDGPAGAEESLGGRQRQRSAQRTLAEFARDLGNGTETRLLLGPRADGIAQVAAEEGADLIVLGSRSGMLGKGRLRCTLAGELEAATPVPVLVVPPTTRPRSDQRLALATANSRS